MFLFLICLRTELKSLIDFAQLVNQGLAQEVLDYLNQSRMSKGLSDFISSMIKKMPNANFWHMLLPYFPVS